MSTASIIHQLYRCEDSLNLCIDKDGVDPKIQGLKKTLDESVKVGFHASKTHPSPA